jgi:outer membrane receptor protein involved in Fe transport
MKSEWRQSSPFGSFGYQFPLSYGGPSPHNEHVGEIRLATQLDGPWNFLGGLYGEELKDNVRYDYIWYGDPTTNFFGFMDAGTRTVAVYSDRRSLKQKAAFGEASWELMSGLTLSGGVRAYHYDRTFKVDADGTGFYGPGGLHGQEAATASGQNFRANLSYKPSDNELIYGSWSQGFRLGQPQVGLPAGLCDPDGNGIVNGTNISIDSTRRVNSDKVDSYEFGGKFSLLDRRMTIAADVFRMDWSDIPVSVFLGSLSTSSCALSYVANAGAALSKGVEFQASFQVTKALRADFGGSWIHARLNKDVPGLNASSGNRLPGSPEVNANLGLQYDFEVVGYKSSVRADSIYVGPFFGNLQESPNTKTNGYVRLDASARLMIRSLNIDLFVRNLTNKDAFTFRSDLDVGTFYGYRMRPRTVGLRFGYAF